MSVSYPQKGGDRPQVVRTDYVKDSRPMNSENTYREVVNIYMEYAENLITESEKENWNKVDILVLLNLVKNDASLGAVLDTLAEQPKKALHTARLRQ